MEQVRKIKKYQLTIYFIGGTTFSTEFDNTKEIQKFQDLIESKETLKKYNNFIRTFNGLEGINVSNINAYQIRELEE